MELSKTVMQVAETRFSSVYMTLKSIQDIYTELRNKLKARGEGERVDKVAPDTLAFLVSFLEPFWKAQRELEGDKYPTLEFVQMWTETLKLHCKPNAGDTPQQAFVRQTHAEWLERKVVIADIHKAATFLWPKYNQLRMMNRQERENVHTYVKNRLVALLPSGQTAEVGREEVEEEEGAAAAVPAKRPRQFEAWEKRFGEEDDENEEDEVDRYTRSMPTMSDDKDVLGWWGKKTA